MKTQAAPDDVKLDMPDPDVPLCADCIDAYRNGIEPGGTACEARADLERKLYAFQTAARELSDAWLDVRTVADIEGYPAHWYAYEEETCLIAGMRVVAVHD